ncbi:anti sigma factor C-terminal domain-containing protein [Radiobacillus deserti]|uniref:Uncharacterized protein n=1 Tax=Radiobacillus deserti TaxID=2594883 RepID=A0A516KEN0_9BACI|nr:anti sigma factor C-terminal domain-containing protein [Radiobacillus deserti]QDP39849.1 hypothetical protein FN924_06525 [Radiobacillus deserti]
MKEEDVLSEWKEQEELVDKKKAKKMVWKTRLSIGFTVIRTLLLLLLIYFLYMVPVEIFYNISGKGNQFNRIVTTLVETHYPGVEVDKYGARDSAEITSLLTKKTSIPLYQSVGNWDVVIGDVSAKDGLFGKLHYTVDLTKKYVEEDMVPTFFLPPDLMGKPVTGRTGEDPIFKEQIEKIEDGYVAEIAFSTTESMEPEQLRSMLAEYDLSIYQMAVFGGEMNEVEVNYAQSGQFTMISPLLLRPAVEYDEKHQISSSYHDLTNKEALQQSIESFYDDMKWLVEHGNYPNKGIDQKRLAYLNEHEMKVFGAIVTGPIREIEKLKDEEKFHQFQLGGIEVWNWSE